MIKPYIGAMWEPPIILEKDIPEEILKEIKEIIKESEEME